MASHDGDTTFSLGAAREPAQGKGREARDNPACKMNLRIPMKPAIDSDLKPASHSDFIPAGIPI